MSDEQKKKISLANKGKIFSEEHRQNLSDSHKGNIPTNLKQLQEYRKGRPLTEEHKEKIRLGNLGRTQVYKSNESKRQSLDNLLGVNGKPAWNKGLKGFNAGEDNPRYIKDRSLLKKSTRQVGTKHREWAEACKTRDGRKCKLGGKDCCGQLEVHHIHRFSEYEELRYELNNGITLCHFHHPRKKKDELAKVELFKSLIA